MEKQSPSLDICLASMIFYPIYAGPAVRFRRYAPGLRRRGISVQVFSGTPDDSRARASEQTKSGEAAATGEIGELLPMLTVDDLPIQQVRLSSDNGRKRCAVYNRALADYCGQSSNRPDLIQFLSLYLWSVPWVPRLRRLHIPLVYTHTLLGELSANALKRRLQRIYWRLPFQLMDCVVVSSGVMREGLRQLGVTTRIEVIPNGIDLNRFRPDADSLERQRLRQLLQIPLQAMVIMAVGPIEPRKASDVLIEAWGRLCHTYPESWLVLVGPRNDRTYPSLQRFGQRIEELVAATGASERIIFTGQVNNVEDYLRTADLFIFPSRREGMPNVVPEAMACGLPTILTPFIGLPDEFGRPGEHYVLVERTSEALATAMVTLLDSPERRQQLGRQGRKWAEEQMDVEKSLDQYAALYHELVNLAKKGAMRA